MSWPTLPPPPFFRISQTLSSGDVLTWVPLAGEAMRVVPVSTVEPESKPVSRLESEPAEGMAPAEKMLTSPTKPLRMPSRKADQAQAHLDLLPLVEHDHLLPRLLSCGCCFGPRKVKPLRVRTTRTPLACIFWQERNLRGCARLYLFQIFFVTKAHKS